MRKLTIATGLLVALVGLGTTVFVVWGHRLDQSSKAYVDAVLPRLFGAWDFVALEGEASPEMIASTSREELQKLFTLSEKRLGGLVTAGPSRGESAIHLGPGKHLESARYFFNATFAKGAGMVGVTLVRHHDRWQISGLHVSSDLLLGD